MSVLKAVGVFWDIENCCVPKGKSALKIIERVRERFFTDCREAEFICVCDIIKEAESTIKDLNDGQINVVHINATAKNAADDKIRQSMRRFSDSHPSGTKVVLISSDVNFAPDLSDLRHRKKFEVVLVHKAQVSEALLACATEHFLYEDLTKDLPFTAEHKEGAETVCVAYGYDKEGNLDKVSGILKMLSSNCGGKVISIGPHYAILKFSTPELTERAKKRMNGADVYGRKITVCLPEESPFNLQNKKWNLMARRQESPSPQRQPARQRSNSRGGRAHTPDEGRRRYNSSGNTSSYADYGLVPAPVEGKGYRTPGGPTRQTEVKVMDDPSQVSPSHTHMLPNSNSAKYYTRSELLTPSDFQGNGQTGNDKIIQDGSGQRKEFFDQIVAKAGSNVVSLSAATQHISLKDIPLPPSGYKHMPPPNMAPSSIAAPSNTAPSIPPAQSNVTPAPLNTPVSATSTGGRKSIDPIMLFEAASKDSQMLKPGLLGLISHSGATETSDSSTAPSQAGKQFQPGAYFKHPEPHRQGRDQGEGHVQHQGQGHTPQGGQPHNQHRSLSVPSSHFMSNKDSGSQGYQPSNSSHRSHSHSSGPHTGDKQQCFNSGQGGQVRRPSAGYNQRGFEHIRPGSTGSNCGNPSSDSTNFARPYSPSEFRPRLASAPSHPPTQGQGRVPSPFSAGGLQGGPPTRPLHRQKGSNIYRVPTPAEIGDPGSDYFHPDFVMGRDPFVELIVSNLDYNISPVDWRKVIYATFQPHVKILSIQVRLQADNTSVATLRLPTEQEARFAISQYHRRKIGYKRINVQLKSDCSHSPAESLRMDTIALLMEEKDNKMALSRLIDLFDKRFHKTVSVSDVYKMRDTIQISESGGGGRYVKLQPGVRRTPTPTQALEREVAEGCDQNVCPIHCMEGSPQYVEALNSCMLPNVLLLRKHFSPQLHSLLLSHNGFIPLMSFPACYAAEFSPMETEKSGGIPLEHVISCVPGVEICVSKAGVKVIQFQQNREPFYDLMKGSAWQELGKISREVMELLRQQATCTMPVSKFIPAYHHYFGKQCRVADYGYTKLQELFEAIPHAIQVLGTGDRRAITLSPRAQIKRFITDIVKVVKSQPAKQIMLDRFPIAYEEAMGKPLSLPHYGVCHMEDVLSDIPTTTLIVIEEGNHVLLALPRRDQTAEEVERTKKFSLEVVDLLKTCPRCCMAFNKFIPAYHHHFGRQCRVSDYGYSKLADLFESVAHVVRLEEEGEERLIQLTIAEMRSVLCEQLTSLLRQAGAVPVSNLLQAYASRFNFGLRLEDYGVDSIEGLLKQLRNHIKVETYNSQGYATLVKEFQIPALGLQVMQLLMDESGGCLPLTELCTRYQMMFGQPCDIAEIKDKLTDFIQVEDSGNNDGLIRLSLQQSLGRNLRLLLLHRPNQRLAMGELYALYRSQYGVDLSPALYGFTSLYQLLLSFPHILEVKGKPPNKYIILSTMLGTPGVLPPARVDVNTQNSGQEMPAPKSSGALMHASQLWDSAIISHSPPSVINPPLNTTTSPPSESTRILKMLKASTDALVASANAAAEKQGKSPSASQGTQQGTPLNATRGATTATEQSSQPVALSPNGVPLAWQMLPGGDKVVSGNLSSDKPAEQRNNKQDEDDDLFSTNNPPLDTSSATSQLNSSSQSSISTNNSPVKRQPKSRIAAKFGKSQ